MEKIGLEAVFEDTNFNQGITNYQNKLETASDKTGKFSSALSGAAKIGGAALIGLAGAAVGAVAGITAMVMKASDVAGELVDMSLKTGVGVEKLQELRYVGDQTGTSLEAITGSMTRLTRAMGDVATSETMAANFERIGVNVTDASGSLRDSEDVFNDVIAALGQIDNEAERDAVAMEIFGRSARELNPLIIAGTDEIARLSEEAHNVGAVMSEDAVMGLEGFGDSMASIKAGVQGTLGTMASAFLPVMQQIASFVTTVILPAFQNFAQVAGPWLAEKLQIAMDWIMGTLIPVLQNQLFPWLSEAIPVAIAFLSDIWQNVLYPALQVVVDIIGNYLIPALKVVWNWLADNLPPVIQALSDIWRDVLQPALEAVWSFITNSLVPILQVIWSWLADNLPPAIQGLSDLWTNTLQPALEVIWNFISKNIIPIFEVVAEIVGITLTLAITALQGAWENVLLPALTKIWEFIDKYLGPVFLWLKDEIIDPVANAIGVGLKNAIQWVIDKLIELRDWLLKIQLPDWMQPGSPTPLEIGLIGIKNALSDVNREFATNAAVVSRYADKIVMATVSNVPQLQSEAQTAGVSFTPTPIDYSKLNSFWEIGAAIEKQRTMASGDYTIRPQGVGSPTISIGPVTITNDMDMNEFTARVETAVLRAMA